MCDDGGGGVARWNEGMTLFAPVHLFLFVCFLVCLFVCFVCLSLLLCVCVLFQSSVGVALFGCLGEWWVCLPVWVSRWMTN